MDLPPTHTEHALVEQAAYAEWKLLRIAAWETEINNATLANQTAPLQALFGKTPHEALDPPLRSRDPPRLAFLNDGLRCIDNLNQLMEKIIAGEIGETNPKPQRGLAHDLVNTSPRDPQGDAAPPSSARSISTSTTL